MNLHSLMRTRLTEDGPIRVAVIGAGKFASMYLTQVLHQPEVHVVGVADLDTQRAEDALERTGWDRSKYGQMSVEEAIESGKTAVVDDAYKLITSPAIEVILEITGNPIVGAQHASEAISYGKHVVMVNVEADVLVGPLLKQQADAAGVVYSMAYGDQPALIAELVDWCRTVGYEVIAAGKGTKYLPEYEQSTPETVWDHYGLSPEQARVGGMNPQMFNSFLDGTKSAIEMAAVANATGLQPPTEGLLFPPASNKDLAQRLIPQADHGVLEQAGTVEVVSSLERDGTELADDLRWGVYVTFKARTDYAERCFAEYGVQTDKTGQYGALYRPYHMIGMELGVTVASAVLRGEPTGTSNDFVADVATVAKRDLFPGDRLDGEGGYTVRGALVPAEISLQERILPIGLASAANVIRPVSAGDYVTWSDIELTASGKAVDLRKELEHSYGGAL